MPIYKIGGAQGRHRKFVILLAVKLLIQNILKTYHLVTCNTLPKSTINKSTGNWFSAAFPWDFIERLKVIA